MRNQDSRPADAVGLRQEAGDTANMRPDLGVSQSAAPSGHGEAGPVANGTIDEARFTVECLLGWTSSRMDEIREAMPLEYSDPVAIADLAYLDAIVGHLAATSALLTRIKDREAAAGSGKGANDQDSTCASQARAEASRNHQAGALATKQRGQ